MYREELRKTLGRVGRALRKRPSEMDHLFGFYLQLLDRESKDADFERLEKRIQELENRLTLATTSGTEIRKVRGI